MARRKRSAARKPRGGPLLSPAHQRELAGAILVVVSVVTLVAFISRGGTLVQRWIEALRLVFGWGAVASALLIGGIGAWLIVDGLDGRADVRWSRPVGALVGFVALLGLTHLVTARLGARAAAALAADGAGGGYLGYGLHAALVPALGPAPSAAALIVAAALGVVFAAGRSVREAGTWLRDATGRGGSLLRDVALALAGAAWARLRGAAGRRARVAATDDDLDRLLTPPPMEPLPAADAPTAAEGDEGAAPRPGRRLPLGRGKRADDGDAGDGDGAGAGGTTPGSATPSAGRSRWVMPPVELILDPAVEVEHSPKDAEQMGRKIEETLLEFGVPVKVVKISVGPTITQFGLEPGYVERAGKRSKVTVRKILSLQNDLALALAASPIRIQAPVPGRPYVGVEVPNAAAEAVMLRGLIEHETFAAVRQRGGLPQALGRDTSGHPVVADLTRMPHLLIAGATGSGKSVAINVLLGSLLFSHTPETLKLILVDPKRVELVQFRGLPHLAAPVVVEVERVIGVLQWATREMDRRYKKFAEQGARNILSFNQKLATEGEAQLPYLVIVIDELADLMMVAPEEAERLITRLAQLARATGIHLVLATQRPSVDVVTGLIKANFPARIAFAVSSSVDSRVILDTVGADKLLGRGDMLYMASDDSKLVRLQGCFMSDDEIGRLVRYWKYDAKVEPEVPEAAESAPGEAPGGAGAAGAAAGDDAELEAETALTLGLPDPLIQPDLWERMVDPERGPLADERDALWGEAIEVIRQHKTASTSFLQRKLRIGYSRAARLMDQLEEAGLVAPAEGNQAREVHIPDDYDPTDPDFRAALDRAFEDDDEIRPWLHE